MASPALDRPGERLRPRFARLGLLGLGMLTTALAIFGVLVVWRFPDEAGFILPMLAVAAVATFLVWRFESAWAHAIGIVTPLGLAFTMFWVAFGLAHPSSFFDFVPAVLFVLGVALAVFGNVAAIVQNRRHHVDAHAMTPERQVEQFAIGLVVLAIVVSGVLDLTGRSRIAEADAADAVALDMSDFTFEPTAVEVPAGGRLLVSNSDPFMHDVAVPDLGIDPVKVGPGSDVLIEMPAAPGTYVLYCTLHSNMTDPAPDPEEQMTATLTVR